MINKFITVSIDDGSLEDFKSAELLKKYNINATFYIPKNNSERSVVNENQIKDLSKEFEIGAHTISHRSLSKMDDHSAYLEILNSKLWLEDLLSKECISFCYPQGKYNIRTPDLVKKAGFVGARTCHFNILKPPRNKYLTGVSTHAYDHSPLIQFRHALVERNFRGLKNYIIPFKLKRNWLKHFMKAIDIVSYHGGIAHLFTHSWEIEEKKDWSRFETALQYAKNSNLKSVTNGQLFKHI